MVSKRSWFIENGWVVLSLTVMAGLLVTAVGYFDEGNNRIYAGFPDYMFNVGLPPVSDYILWSAIFVVLGTALFHMQKIVPSLRKAFVIRLLVSVFAIPIFIFAVLVILATA